MNRANAPTPAAPRYAHTPCAVCAALKEAIENVLKYLDHAKHAECDRGNVESFAKSLLTIMKEATHD